jgi:RNA polymerase sigma factor (sigma-70 family)
MLYTHSLQHSVLQRIPDGVLLEQAQAGDQHAFELLVGRYQHLLAHYIQGFLKNDNQVSDVLQQVYLQLYVSLPTLLTNRPLKSWLFRVDRNRCLDELRRRRRRPETLLSSFRQDYGEEDLFQIEDIPDPDPLPEEVVEREDLYRALQEAIASLPPKFRPVVQLHCFRQLTFAEIARVLKMPEASAKTYFYRALLRLRRTIASNTLVVAIL